nr:signal peptidase I [Brachyspira hampsonii]
MKNFDVVVFNYNDTNLVKRVIGIEGDKVEIKDGGLYLNDNLIEHEYYIFSSEDDGLYILGNNQYFVLGDNIKVSEDSRYFGLVDEKDIKGQVILIFSPKKRFQLFNNIFHHNNISE